MTTDPIITAAKVDASDRERISAGLLLMVDPAAALDAAIARIAYLEERNDELQEDVASLRADVRRLTDERDQARCAAADNAHQHERLLEERDTLQRAIARIVTCPPEEEIAAMAGGGGNDVAERIVAKINDLHASFDEAIARLREERDRARLAARAPTKPEAQPAATVEPATTQADRYVAITRDKIPPGTPPDRLAWSEADMVAASATCASLNSGMRREVLSWDNANGPGSVAILDRGEPAPTPPAKPSPRYAPSPIDHPIEAWGPLANARYVAVPASAAKGVPPDRVLWRSAERLASRDADELNRGDRRRDFYGWGDDSTPEVRLWAVVDRGEPIGEEG